MKRILPFAVLGIVGLLNSILFMNCSGGGFQSTATGTSMSTSSGSSSSSGSPTNGNPTGGGSGSGGSGGAPVGSLPPAPEPVVVNHPRLWLADTQNVTRLKSAIASNSPYWTNLKSFCDNTSSSIPQGNAYQGDMQFQYIASFALCYQMTGNAAYAQKAIKLLTTNDCAGMTENTYGCSPLYFSFYSTDDGYGIRNYVPAMAVAYDWLYSYMGTAVSVSDLSGKTLGAALIQRMNAWLAWYAQSGFCRVDDPSCQNFPAPHTGVGIANYFSGYLLAQVAAGVAIGSDDSTGANVLSMAESLYSTGIGDLDTYLTEGHHPEGSYGSGVYERYGLAAAALRWSTNDADFYNSHWLANYPFLKLGAVTSDGQFYYDDGMWHWAVQPTTNDSVMSGYMYGWGSTTGQVVTAYLKLIASTSPIAQGGSWETFLFYDSTGTATPLSSLAKSYVTPTFGASFMRSDWSGSSSTWASLSTARWTDTEGEAYPDAGQVEIYKGGSNLLINAGFGDRWGSSQDDSTYYNTFTFANRTDGGTPGQHWFVTAGCPNPTGSDPIGLKKFADGGDYVFTAGEFSAAYQAGNCSKVPANFLVRNELYVRPDLFFVYDQVSVLSGTPTEHFHFAVSPVSSGANQWTVTNGSGILQIAVVSPAVTASMKSQAVNAVTYSDGSSGPQVANVDLAMVASTQKSYQSFLNLFRAGLSSGGYAFPNYQAVASSIGVGVRVTGMLASENSTPIVAIFADNTQNSPSTSVKYTVPSSPGAYHYIALLQPKTNYQVTESISGGQVTVTIMQSSSGPFMSDDSGLLRFKE